MIDAIKGGRAGTAEFGKNVAAATTMGPIFAILTVAIAVLMVWKPLDRP